MNFINASNFHKIKIDYKSIWWNESPQIVQDVWHGIETEKQPEIKEKKIFAISEMMETTNKSFNFLNWVNPKTNAKHKVAITAAGTDSARIWGSMILKDCLRLSLASFFFVIRITAQGTETITTLRMPINCPSFPSPSHSSKLKLLQAIGINWFNNFFSSIENSFPTGVLKIYRQEVSCCV